MVVQTKEQMVLGVRDPEEDKLSPVTGIDPAEYEKLFAQAQNGDPVAMARIGYAHGNEPDGGKSKNEKEEKFWQELQVNLAWIQQYRDDLNDYAELLRQRLAEIDTIVAGNLERIAEIRKTHEGALLAMDYCEKNGFFERDTEGNLLSKDAQKLLDAYAKRTGQKPESDGAIRQALLLQMRFEKDHEIPTLEKENKRLGHERTEVQTNLNTVEGQIKAIDEVINDKNASPAQKAAAIKKIMDKSDTKAMQKIEETFQDNDMVQEVLLDKFMQGEESPTIAENSADSYARGNTPNSPSAVAESPTKTPLKGAAFGH